MNITAYNEKTRYLMPLGVAILKGGYAIASADEFLYKYLDMNSDRMFTELIHPEDRHLFTEAAEKAEETPQYVLVRFLTQEMNYKYMLLRLKPDKFVIDGVRCIEVYVTDIIAAMEKHKVNRTNLTKYRRVMSLTDYLYFDYVKESNHINIYMYANDKNYMFLSEDLDVWSDQMRSIYLWKDSEKKKFEMFYSCLKDGLDDFKIQLATTFFSKAKRIDSVLISGSILFDTDGSKIATGVIKLNADIMEKPYYTTEAGKDSATGLMNKRAIMEYAAQRIKETSGTRLSLFIIDIDDFKRINDTYGHLFGDEVIFRTAETIRRLVGRRGVVARFGGDEFVVLLEDVDEKSMEYLLKTIYGEIGLLCKDVDSNLTITVSTGVSNYPQDGNTYEELFQKADKALYMAKGEGKNRYVIYDDNVHRDIEFVDDSGRIKGLKSIGTRVNRSILYSDIMLSLANDSSSDISDVVVKVRELFDVDGVSAYIGDDLRCVLRHGKYPHEVKCYTLLGHEDFVNLIAEDDMAVVEDVKQMCDKSFYENYRRVEINANVVCIYRQNGKVKGLLSFDVFNTSKQWTEMDLIALNAIGKMALHKLCQEKSV